jgi:hypothetical protein
MEIKRRSRDSVQEMIVVRRGGNGTDAFRVTGIKQ